MTNRRNVREKDRKSTDLLHLHSGPPQGRPSHMALPQRSGDETRLGTTCFFQHQHVPGPCCWRISRTRL